MHRETSENWHATIASKFGVYVSNIADQNIDLNVWVYTASTKILDQSLINCQYALHPVPFTQSNLNTNKIVRVCVPMRARIYVKVLFFRKISLFIWISTVYRMDRVASITKFVRIILLIWDCLICVCTKRLLFKLRLLELFDFDYFNWLLFGNCRSLSTALFLSIYIHSAHSIVYWRPIHTLPVKQQ